MTAAPVEAPERALPPQLRPEVAVNAAPLQSPMVGVPRYLQELLPHVPGLALLRPEAAARRIRGGYLCWEQVVLPTQLRGRLLWSPGGTGPLVVRHQVVTIHDVVALEFPEWVERHLGAWYRYLVPRLVRSSRHVVAISAFTRSRLLALTGVAPSRVTVVLHGVDPRFRPQPGAEVLRVRTAAGLSANPYILAVGTREPRKNLARLFAAWEAVQSRFPEVELVIAGMQGSRRDFGRQAPERLPARTRLLGHVADADLPSLYSGAQAFAYPSMYEGFGKPPLEAMACGVPVIAGNRTAIPEIVGGAGLLVEPEDVAAIAGALARLLASRDLRTELSARGLARAAQFRWCGAAAATRAILDRYR
ncbi:MAG: glycosyltransferase family 4 protein [Terriglobales bacterium]